MTRINTNIGAMIAQHNLAGSNRALAVSLERLSTGLAINRGADNPAGLIISERLRTEISGVATAISNIERASNVLATTEAALAEVSDLLTSIKGLTIEAANTGGFSEEEIAANQLQIDSAIESITRISNTASFGGLKVLNGTLDYILSGVSTTNLPDVKIFGANFGTNTSIPISVEVINSAETASLFLSGNTTGATGALLSSVTFEVQGNKGAQVFSFVSGTTLSAVTYAINNVSDATGVTAALASATNQTSGMTLSSQTLGSDAFVAVRRLEDGAFFGTYDQQGGSGINRDVGEDVLSLVNGSLALGNGSTVSLRSASVNLEVSLSTAAAQTLATHNFTIVGGGAEFQIGPSINSSQQVGFGIQSVSASHLGERLGGFLSSVLTGGDNSLVNGRARQASEIIDLSIDQVAILRGRLGAFERNTLDTASRSQQIALENLTAAESRIRDTDFARETSQLTRAQILVQAGTSTLAIANNSAQSVLSLLQ
jgi:flagellin